MKAIVFTACAALLSAQYSFAQDQLSDALPAEVGLYLRIPSVLGWIADGQEGRVFEQATAQAGHQAALQQIRNAFAKLDDLPPSGDAAIKFLLAEQSAPLEIAVFKQDGVVSPLSPILVQTMVRARNEAAFKKQFDELLSGSGMPMPYTFDASTGRLQLQVGATPERFAQLNGGAKNKAVNTEFVAAQNRIDQSGKGLLLWADSQAIAPMLAMVAASSEASNKWVFDALQGLDGFALGAGSVGTGSRSGRMALDFYFDPKAMPEWTQYFQPEPRHYDFLLSGAPSWVANYSLPTNPKDLDRILRKIESLEDESKAQKPSFDFDAALAGGPSVRQILTSVGPEMAYFHDAAGTFGALKIRNRAVFNKFIANAGKHGFYELREGIHHLRFDSNAFTGVSALKQDSLALLGRLSVSTVYWVEEGDWLIAAPVPQLLRDRKAISGRISAEKWLQQRSNVAASDQILAFAAHAEGTPTQIWYGYLALLETLGHIGKTNIDLFALPSARDLGLPSAGFAGVSVDYTPQRLGFAVNYGASPGDLIGGGNMLGTVAVVSIMAAIALPAYQDYTLRSKVTTALVQAQAAKVELQELYATNGTLPKSQRFETTPDLKLRWNGKLLLLSFTEDYAEPLLRGKTIAFVPELRSDGIEFFCAFSGDGKTSLGGDAGAATSVAAKYLPMQCR